jgi:hypothetical protein
MFLAASVEAKSSADFGNTLVHLRRAAIVGTIFTIITAIIGVSVGHAHGRITAHWPDLVFIPLCIGGILPLVIAVTCLFSLRVDERHVTHLFCSRLVLSRHPLSELESFEVGGTSAVVFRFSSGVAIHFFGAHREVIQALCERIHELRPDLACT